MWCVFVNVQHCWKHYITHYHGEPFFQVSAVSLNPNNTGGTLKLLNSIQWYASKRV
jgi:hypothetical protein